MRALLFDGNESRVSEVAEPQACDESVLVRVSLSGVCNTDLEIVKGYMQFRGILGHEFVGKVEAGPPEWRGQRVVGEINFACRSCPICAQGLHRHCPSRAVMGILDADGAFAEFVRLPVTNLHPVPDSIADEIAVFTEPLAAAFAILEQTEIEPGHKCSVLGDGKLGLLVAQVLQQAGASVLAVGKHPEKLAILGKRGIATALASEWNGEPTSLVVEATGTAEGLAHAIAATLPRGTLVLKSTLFERLSLDLSRIVVDEIRVVGSRCGPFPPALRALETGSVDVGSLVSHRVALNDAVEGLRKASQPGALKVLIEP